MDAFIGSRRFEWPPCRNACRARFPYHGGRRFPRQTVHRFAVGQQSAHVDARLVPKYSGTGNRLRNRQRPARRSGDQPGKMGGIGGCRCRKFLFRVNRRAMTTSSSGGIAGPLAQSVHRHVGTGGASERAASVLAVAMPKSLCAVEPQGQVRHGGPQTRNRRMGLERIPHAHGIGQAKAVGSRLPRSSCAACQEARSRPRRILRSDRNKPESRSGRRLSGRRSAARPRPGFYFIARKWMAETGTEI